MGRSPCCEKTGLKKGPWTTEEDQKLVEYIHKNGYGNWRTLPKNAGLQRCGKSCRLRWTNYLRPDIKRGKFSFEEEEAIIHLHSILGNKWSAIAAQLPGRTDNEIKNYWNTHIRKKLLRMGIDPVTHRPRLDILDLSNVLTYGKPQIDFNSRLLGFHQSLARNPQLLRSLTCFLNSPQLQHADDVFLPTSDFLPTAFAPNMNQIDNSQVMQYDDVCHFPENQIDGGSVEMAAAITDELGYVSGRAGAEAASSPEGGSGFNFGGYTWQSGFSTPNSSNSNYNVVNSCNDENERESYCSGLIKFEIPDGLDFSEFM